MKHTYGIRPITEASLEDAIALTWEVFEEFEAPDYPPEGVREFRDYIAYDAMAARLREREIRLWGAYDDTRLVGVIAVRAPCHISLLFVDKAYHRRGIARSLVRTVADAYMRDENIHEMTVHASPYGLPAYYRLGFKSAGAEQLENGLRFTLMRRILRKCE